uniref:Follistatin-like 4 n=1 Tax=Scleropages formosus TaxID=113540 RepID=A0A8C9S4X6_SCLFO
IRNSHWLLPLHVTTKRFLLSLLHLSTAGFTVTTPRGACRRKFCGRGRRCELEKETGRAHCVCQERCHPAFVPVCGSDGWLYENHCEVYRTACLHRRKITVVHNKDCFFKGITCTIADYNKLKSALLDLQFKSLSGEGEGEDKHRTQKRAMVDSLFKHLDVDNNSWLDKNELTQIFLKGHLEGNLSKCSTDDLLRYDDYNNDEQLTLQEFLRAFQVAQLNLPEEKRVIVSTVTVGLSLVLSCDIQGSQQPPVMWKRNGINLNFLDLEDINDFGDDGSLYITKVTTIHMGNYTCHLRGYEDPYQTHVLQVNVPPVILVYPETQAQEPGVAASMHCYADGIPNPNIVWLKNGMDLSPKLSNQLSLMANGSVLHIGSVRYEDTGAYTCIAKNEVGVDEDISSLFVEDSARKTLANILWREKGLSTGNVFYVFSEEGMTIVQPNECEIHKHIKATERIMGSNGDMCPEVHGSLSQQRCVWAMAANVRDKYIYITQPLHNRLLIIDTQGEKVMQAVETDPVPVKVHYDKSHDQVWVLSWGDMQKSYPTLQVISRASVGEEHHAAETRFQKVDDFFIPPTNLIITHVRFGFIFFKSEAAVHKIDLETFHHLKTISLKSYNCVPVSMAYTHMSGYYFIQCQEGNSSAAPPQLIIDSVTDFVIGNNLNLKGKPHVSPNGRFVVTLEHERQVMTVQNITFKGELQLCQEIDTVAPISQLVFQPSFTEANQYMIIATSRAHTDLFFYDLSSRRREVLRNLKNSIPTRYWPWNHGNGLLVNSGLFGQYLVMGSDKSLLLLNVKQKKIHCEVSEMQASNTVVWVEEV